MIRGVAHVEKMLCRTQFQKRRIVEQRLMSQGILQPGRLCDARIYRRRLLQILRQQNGLGRSRCQIQPSGWVRPDLRRPVAGLTRIYSHHGSCRRKDHACNIDGQRGEAGFLSLHATLRIYCSDVLILRSDARIKVVPANPSTAENQ